MGGVRYQRGGDSDNERRQLFLGAAIAYGASSLMSRLDLTSKPSFLVLSSLAHFRMGPREPSPWC